MPGDAVQLADRLARIEGSIEALRADLARYFSEHEEGERRIRALELQAARQNERLGLVAGALTVLQLIGSAIAAWVGASK